MNFLKVFAQSDNLLLFKRDCRYGFINTKGMEVIPAKFRSAHPFNEGLAGVCIKDKCGFINTKGEIIIPLIYSYVGQFQKGLAYVSLGDLSEGFYINKSGIRPNKKPYSASYFFPDDWDKYFDTDKGKFGIKTSDKIILPAEYDGIGIMQNGFIEITKNGKSGFLDSLGRIVVEPKYYRLNDFNDSLALFIREENSRSYGYINPQGIEVISDTLQLNFNTNFLSFVNLNDSFILIHQLDFSEGVAVRGVNKSFGYIDKSGEWVINPDFESSLPFSNGLGRVKLNGKWGMINSAGEKIIDFKFDSLCVFSEGLATFKLNGKWGFINMQQEEVVKPEYDDVSFYYQGLAPAFKNGKYTSYFQDNCDDRKINLYYLDKKGKVIWKQE